MDKNRSSTNNYRQRFSGVEIVNDYYDWLCDIVKINAPRKSYFLLAQTLHRTPYYWFVPNDDNREKDGLGLREEFIESTPWQVTSDFVNRPCSTFEVLIALAKRIEDTMESSPDAGPIEKWFWMMMKNAGLDKFSDDRYFDFGGTQEVNDILTTILARTYKRDGRGGLFPLRDAKKDQRKVEIWYQMNTYLLENYYLDW